MKYREKFIVALVTGITLGMSSIAIAQDEAPERTLFTNVNDGGGRTLTPGLIDMHTHITFETPAGTEGFNQYDFGAAGAMAAQVLRDNMLMKGITTGRDIVGNSRGIAKLIQQGHLIGARLYTSGGVLSPTGGHGDWGGPTDTVLNQDYGAMVEQSYIIEGRDSVIAASRRNFRNGAHFTKIMAGGGVSSLYDPLEIYAATQEEVEAAVEIANDYGTYVAIHAYHDGSYKRSLDAGVRSFEHGFLVTEPTVKRMAKMDDIVWSFQCFMSVATFGDYDAMSCATCIKNVHRQCRHRIEVVECARSIPNLCSWHHSP